MPTHTARRQRRKRRRKKQRLVYVIARPLKAAGPFSSLSGTEFALCHWGLFVTDPRDRDRNTSLSISALKGTLFELLRQENNINTPSTTTDFGVAQWKTEWKYVLITAVGETDVSDEELRAQASTITRKYPDYDGYTNNCQNFVQYLLAFACPSSTLLGPKTIREMVEAVIPSEIPTSVVYSFLSTRQARSLNTIGGSDRNNSSQRRSTPSLVCVWISVVLFE